MVVTALNRNIGKHVPNFVKDERAPRYFLVGRLSPPMSIYNDEKAKLEPVCDAACITVWYTRYIRTHKILYKASSWFYFWVQIFCTHFGAFINGENRFSIIQLLALHIYHENLYINLLYICMYVCTYTYRSQKGGSRIKKITHYIAGALRVFDVKLKFYLICIYMCQRQ